jgi:hypothetical protein
LTFIEKLEKHRRETDGRYAFIGGFGATPTDFLLFDAQSADRLFDVQK